MGPTDTFNRRLQILDWAGRPVDTAANRTTDWEQWRSGGNGQGQRLAQVLDDPIRGSTQVRVDNPAGLRQGSYVLMTWRSQGAEGDFGLMKRLGGNNLMSSGFPWASADRMYAPATPRYRWPVRIKRIDGDRVTLAQPMRIGSTAAELDTDFQRLGPVITDCGVEALTIVTNGSRHPHATHLLDHGCNGIFFNRVVDCWARDVTIERPENGILFSCAKSVTVERFTIRADSSVQVHHATAVRSFSADILQRDFTVDAPRVFHGVNHEWMSSGCVWSRGRLVNGTFDSHRGLPFDNVRTEITLERNTGIVGGAVYAGPRNGRRIVHWNIDNRGTSGAAVLEPDAFTSSAMVGVRSPRKTGCADGMVCGDKNVLEVATGQVPNPVNLHDAQVAVRMAELPPSRAEVVDTARRVGDYWMRANPAPGSNEWNNSTYHSGNLALWRLTGDGRYLDHTLAWARFHNWGLRGGVTTRHADNHLAGEVYLELYGVTTEPVRIAAVEQSIRQMVFTDQPAKNDDWWWVDALHMAMPVFARLGALRGDNAFWEKMFRLYTHTKRAEGGPGLYSYPHELWYRDHNYVPGRKTTPGRASGVLVARQRLGDDGPRQVASRPPGVRAAHPGVSPEPRRRLPGPAAAPASRRVLERSAWSTRPTSADRRPAAPRCTYTAWPAASVWASSTAPPTCPRSSAPGTRWPTPPSAPTACSAGSSGSATNPTPASPSPPPPPPTSPSARYFWPPNKSPRSCEPGAATTRRVGSLASSCLV